jgi:hypothetical protein
VAEKHPIAGNRCALAQPGVEWIRRSSAGAALPLPRLSIVIPALGSLDALEATLVSVLQNRPSSCEVIVALDRAYADPYQLAEEVRFAVVKNATSIADVLGGALKLCRGSIVHVLGAGVEVDEDWTDAALEHFHDDRIAAVAPLVFHSRNELHLCSAGLAYTRGGRRYRRGAGGNADDFARNDDVLGPTHLAAFYRREALLRLPKPFEPAVTDALIDADLALQLKSAGYRAIVEPRSIVYREAAVVPASSAFAAGRGAERLFWRNAGTIGWLPSLAAHLFTVLGDFVSTKGVGEKFGRLVGRLAAAVDLGSYLRHRAALRTVGTPGLAFAVTSTGDRIRIDAAHPRPVTATKPTTKADQRTDGESGRAA